MKKDTYLPQRNSRFRKFGMQMLLEMCFELLKYMILEPKETNFIDNFYSKHSK